ncbi:hypothetical protein [Sphingomonas sp. 28-63-12]|uniref:hypothetical protein n=1 Tax=Sphingomonas sp. 28-63-12 TaxID=1970434 RepID=UPI0035A888EA
MIKRLVEDCLTLDLAWLMRLGPIAAGQVGSGEIHWADSGAPVRSARFRLDLRTAHGANLTVSSGAINQSIALVAVAQHFGGHRWWFRCPVTNERARILLLPPEGSRFASRKALKLAYRVERLARFDRSFEKMFRMQRKLNGAQGLGAGLARPKGMWKKTFARHTQRFEIFDIACAEKIAAMIVNA